jgi:hypothetical protein
MQGVKDRARSAVAGMNRHRARFFLLLCCDCWPAGAVAVRDVVHGAGGITEPAELDE